MTAPEFDHNGPFFDQLRRGHVFEGAPALTLTPGRAAVHHAIVGGRLRLSLDEHLSREVAGAPLADPAFAWDVAIGQSTLATRRVIANLFYRGLAFHRFPLLGDTLHTRTEIVGLRQNRSRPSGLAAMRITTRDHEGRLVLDFWRCAMLPLSDPGIETGHDDDLDAVGQSPVAGISPAPTSTWDLARLQLGRTEVRPGDTWQLESGDVVSSAPELARTTLNIAHVHHDEFVRDGRRLVYGGHTIGLALAQVTRVLPELVTVVAWHGCDHSGPVYEGDTLRSNIEVERVDPVAGRLQELSLRVRTSARSPGADERPVLDWRLVALAR